ncbi:hypothetical protein CEXT_8641 [Caerostris extrusa]|uniref:Uncharacterized protein n=1 Tax=Caerostris extrusa TaxID=172846 RepID=A0AAV4UWG9_CAEEX|nr:hypothetical protein CEXT_8641 [Caerostris extrusa]
MSSKAINRPFLFYTTSSMAQQSHDSPGALVVKKNYRKVRKVPEGLRGIEQKAFGRDFEEWEWMESGEILILDPFEVVRFQSTYQLELASPDSQW